MGNGCGRSHLLHQLISRSGEAESRLVHTQEVAGAIPAFATSHKKVELIADAEPLGELPEGGKNPS